MHAHPHPHVHRTDLHRTEHVVLDVGGDVGALLVYTGEEMLGEEVEISAAGADDRREHQEVLERDLGGVSRYVLVYNPLAAGEYTLWLDGAPRLRNVRVEGGAVAELDWPTG